jgi:hypothetical protein
MVEKKKPPKSAGKSETRGRSSHRPSAESRMTVEQMRYCGESEDIIARALSVHPSTLRKHYGNELADGYAQTG